MSHSVRRARLALAAWSTLLLVAVTAATAGLTVVRPAHGDATTLTVALIVAVMVGLALTSWALTIVLPGRSRGGRSWVRSRRGLTLARAGAWLTAVGVVDSGLLLQLLTAQRIWPIAGAAVGLLLLVAARPGP